MLISEIKPIGKVGKNLLQTEDPDKIIETIIEKPLQKACKLFSKKNIETVMSSCNKRNLIKNASEKVSKRDIVEKLDKNKILTFIQAGKGYAWIMVNYNTLSDQNKETFYSLEETLGEDTIWFVQTNYFEVMNKLRKFFKLKELNENVDDKYNELFNSKKLMLMYNNKYPTRNVFIRMPIDENTKVSDVEIYFESIINQLFEQ